VAAAVEQHLLEEHQMLNQADLVEALLFIMEELDQLVLELQDKDFLVAHLQASLHKMHQVVVVVQVL
jgi:hypothetical protein